MILVSPREDLLEGDLGQPTAQNFEARRGFGHVEAMRLLHRHAGVVAEPSGAAGLAAVVQDPDRFAGQTIGTIICGGNLTPTQVREWLAATGWRFVEHFPLAGPQSLVVAAAE